MEPFSKAESTDSAISMEESVPTLRVRRWWPLILSIGIALLGGLLISYRSSALLYLRNQGLVELTGEAEGISILATAMDGNRRHLLVDSDKSVTLRAGEYELQIAEGVSLELIPSRIKLAKGAIVVVHVRKIDTQATAGSDLRQIDSTINPEPQTNVLLDSEPVIRNELQDPPDQSPASPLSDESKSNVDQDGLADSIKMPIETTNSIGMRLVEIPAGEFTMGSPNTEVGRQTAETQHKVTITRSFHIGVCEVTQSQYEKVMGKNPSQFKIPDNPVDQVSWDDAMDFCHRLSRMPMEHNAGHKYRLPTEAEWEFACRAGSVSAFSFGDDESRLSDFAWFSDDSGAFPIDSRARLDRLDYESFARITAKNDCHSHTVGTKQPNHFGLYDMHGNVWELCLDLYADLPNGHQTNPSGASVGSERSIRSGSSDSPPEFCRSSSRLSVAPTLGTPTLGFRVCR